VADTEIFRNYNFSLELGQGVVGGYFTEVSGMGVKVEAIDYREGGAALAVRKLPGRVSYGDITLRWGMSQSTEMWDWLLTAVNGTVLRREVSIILLSPDGQGEQVRWNLRSAWVTEWRGSRLDASAQGAAIESMMLTHEGLERD
jgi:phage tail-like protein